MGIEAHDWGWICRAAQLYDCLYVFLCPDSDGLHTSISSDGLHLNHIYKVSIAHMNIYIYTFSGTSLSQLFADIFEDLTCTQNSFRSRQFCPVAQSPTFISVSQGQLNALVMASLQRTGRPFSLTVKKCPSGFGRDSACKQQCRATVKWGKRQSNKRIEPPSIANHVDKIIWCVLFVATIDYNRQWKAILMIGPLLVTAK